MDLNRIRHPAGMNEEPEMNASIFEYNANVDKYFPTFADDLKVPEDTNPKDLTDVIKHVNHGSEFIEGMAFAIMQLVGKID